MKTNFNHNGARSGRKATDLGKRAAVPAGKRKE